MIRYLLVAIPIALQVLCIIHIIRNGKDRIWVYVIIFLSLAGCIAYLIMELIPDMLRSRKTREIGTAIANTVAPGRKLRELEERFDHSDTLDNRTALADELINCGEYDRAEKLIKEGMEGIFKDDSSLQARLAKISYFREDWNSALVLLSSIKDFSGGLQDKVLRFYYARVLDELDMNDDAEKEYGSLLKTYYDPEYAYYYGKFLQKSGNNSRAVEIFQELLRRSKHIHKTYRKEKSQWINLARKELSELS